MKPCGDNFFKLEKKKDFRSACDGVFARLDDQRKQQNSAKNEQQEQYKAAKAAQAGPRLVKGMGSAGAIGSQEEQLLEQVNGFIAMRPANQLLERFCPAIEAVHKNS